MTRHVVHGFNLKMKQLIWMLILEMTMLLNLSKVKLLENTETDGDDVTMVVPLKYLSSFWRPLEMPLANCKIELSLIGLWLYVLIMSRTCFRVNPHSIVAWMSRNSLLEGGTKSEI